MHGEQIIISAGGYNLIFTKHFIERYNSIFKQNPFREVEAFSLYYLLNSSQKNPFGCLNFFGKCQIRLDMYGNYCRLFMEKVFGEDSLLPRNIIRFNEITWVRDVIEKDGFEKYFGGHRQIPIKKKYPRRFSLQKIIEEY